MVFQLIAITAFLAACSAAIPPAPLVGNPVVHPWDAPSGPAQYDYGYSVSNPVAADIKGQSERHRGDDVQGRYSVLESEGTKRKVEYTADAVNRFNAVVNKEPNEAITHPVEPKVDIVPNKLAVAPVPKSVPDSLPRAVAPSWNGLNSWNSLNSYNGLNSWNGPDGWNGLGGYSAPYSRGAYGNPYSGYTHPYAVPYNPYGSPYNYGRVAPWELY